MEPKKMEESVWRTDISQVSINFVDFVEPKELTFSSSKVCRAFAHSSFAFFCISFSSNSNFRFTPLPILPSVSPASSMVGCFRIFFLAPSMPIITFSNSKTDRSFSSSPLALSPSSSSLCRLTFSFSNRLISFLCASKLLTAHSRQKTSPFDAQPTGSRAICKQSWQEAKGRKESRERRVACEPHVDLRRLRSCEVKNASEVFRLPNSL